MNRRQFFSFAAVAPVALPMAAKAMAARSPEFVFGGIDLASYSPGIGSLSWTTPNIASQRMLDFEAFHEACVTIAERTLSVGEQFDADLALLSETHCQGDGTHESTSDALT